MRSLSIISLFLCLLSLVGCSSDDGSESEKKTSSVIVTEPTQEEPAVEEAPEEPSDGLLGLEESYEAMHRGARLTLAYDAEKKSFTGTVENMMRDEMTQVLVKVSLSDGSELSETVAKIDAGSRRRLVFEVGDAEFDRWTATAAPGGEVAVPDASETP